jgi:2'-phosphotransferase
MAELRAVVADNEKQRFSLRRRDDSAGVGSSASGSGTGATVTPRSDATSPGNTDKAEGTTDKSAVGTVVIDESFDSSSASDWLIRANQGHSIKLDSSGMLRPLTIEDGNIPEVVVHGTYLATWSAIERTGGLSRMNRNHVHFATGLPSTDTGVVSGMRADAEVLVYIDVAKTIREGKLEWWMSDNGVVLTEGDADGIVRTEYFSEVKARGKWEDKVGVLWKDGEKVGDIPGDVRGRVPPGRGRGGRAGGGSRGGRA